MTTMTKGKIEFEPGKGFEEQLVTKDTTMLRKNETSGYGLRTGICNKTRVP